MPRRIVRFTLAFTLAGIIIPIALMIVYGAALYDSSPAIKQTFRSVAVFFWPTGMSLAGGSVPEPLPIDKGVATIVAIVENAVLYAILGLFLGFATNLIWPDKHRFDEHAAEDKLEAELEQKLIAKAQHQGK